MATVKERVKAGAALLDEKRPGWAREVSVPQLNIESSCSCILGQLFRGYDYGLAAVGIPYGAEHGFFTDEGPGKVKHIEMLWIKEIEARTNVATPE